MLVTLEWMVCGRVTGWGHEKTFTRKYNLTICCEIIFCCCTVLLSAHKLLSICIPLKLM